jgi:hypothetical protein
MLPLSRLPSGTFAAFAAVRHGGSKEKQNNKEEELTMRVLNRLCGLRSVIAFAAVLLIGGTAFPAITDPQVDTVDLLPDRTQVTLTGSVVCDNTTDAGTGTATIYQVHGRHLYMGLGTVAFDCSTGTWSAPVDAIDGFKFQPGPATLLIDFFNTGDATPFAKGAKIKLQ